MKVAVAFDHRGVHLREAVLESLSGHDVLDFGTHTDFGDLFATFLQGLPDGGVIMCHPGLVDAELARNDTLTSPREREYTFFQSSAYRALLAQHGYALASR